MKEKPRAYSGDHLLAVLAALANPHRLRVIAVLASGGRSYVSQLAREIRISRPLLHLHLQKLEESGYVVCEKAFVGQRPKSTYRLTSVGRKSLVRYLDTMQAIIDSANLVSARHQ